MVLKKSTIIILIFFSLSLILIISTGCQQSGCSNDFDCGECEECINRTCNYIKDCCINTDGHYDYYEQGVSILNNRTKGDECFYRKEYNHLKDRVNNCSGLDCGLVEVTCFDKQILNNVIICPYGCKDGACINENNEGINGTCFDSDGNDTFTRGQVILNRSNLKNTELNYQLISYSDVCLTNGFAMSKSGDSLNEQICENDKWVSQKINCTCQDGVCINETTQDNNSPEEHSESISNNIESGYEESNIEPFEKIQVSDEDLKKISVALTSDDIDFCDSLGDNKDLCLAYFGIKNNDYSSCEELDGRNKYVCYIGIIGNRIDFEKCYDSFTEINPLTIERENLGDDGAMFYCNIYIFKMNEINSCENKPEGILVANKALAWEKACKIYNDISGQNDFNPADAENCGDDRCLIDLFHSTHDESICSMITSADYSYMCFTGLAIFKEDISLCPNSHPFCVSKILGLEKENI